MSIYKRNLYEKTVSMFLIEIQSTLIEEEKPRFSTEQKLVVGIILLILLFTVTAITRYQVLEDISIILIVFLMLGGGEIIYLFYRQIKWISTPNPGEVNQSGL